MTGYDLMHRFFRRKPKVERKLLLGDLRIFWWSVADNVDRTSPRGLL